MNIVKLSEDYSLAIEVEGKRLRLIVFEDEEELVCRKTTAKELNQFLSGTENILFKGRLQLRKNAGQILIQVRGEVIGLIRKELLCTALEI